MFSETGLPDEVCRRHVSRCICKLRRSDDEKHDGSDAGWVTSLKRLLEIELDRKLGKVDACDIWMDHRIPIGSSLSNELFETVRSSTLMLVVLSKGYLRSPWCNGEMKWFLAEEARRRSKSPTSARVFVLETDRVEVLTN